MHIIHAILDQPNKIFPEMGLPTFRYTFDILKKFDSFGVILASRTKMVLSFPIMAPQMKVDFGLFGLFGLCEQAYCA